MVGNERLGNGNAEFKDEDIEKFCNDVIRWKTTACKKDEIFQTFRDNPYYLFGYLCYTWKKNETVRRKNTGISFGFSITALCFSVISLTLTAIQYNPVMSTEMKSLTIAGTFGFAIAFLVIALVILELVL